MTKLSHALLCVVTVSTFAGLSHAAQAKCAVKGNWHAVSIAIGTGENFPGTATVAAGCRLKIKSNGEISGKCRAGALEDPSTDYTLTGSLKANSKCELSGVWKVASFPEATLLAGFASENLMAFAATRGDPAFQTRSVTLIRD